MEALRNATREPQAIVHGYVAKLYAANDTAPGREISMRPHYLDALQRRVHQLYPFMDKINTPLVSQDKGPLLFEDWADPIIKRTNVYGPPVKARTPADPKVSREYEVAEREFDLLSPWPRLEAWSLRGSGGFEGTYRDHLARRVGADMLRVAFLGTSRATTSTTGIPDVDVGWIGRLRGGRPANVISEIIVGSGSIFIGQVKVVNPDAAAAVDVGGGVVGIPATGHGFKSGAQIVVAGTVNYNGTYLVLPTSTLNQVRITAAYVAENFTGAETLTQTPDFPSLDALAADLRLAIDPVIRNELAVMVGPDVLAGEEQRLRNSGVGTPGEKAVIQQSMSMFGGMPLEEVPFVPDMKVVVTPLRNLSIYRHDSWRRSVQDSQEYKGLLDWNRFKESYEVENLDLMMVAENVLFA